MNIRRKKLSIISLILVLALSMVGCTRSDEVAVYKAIQKNMDIRSMESNTEVSLTLEGTGLDEATQMMLDQAKTTLNSSKLYINQKQALNAKGTVGKAEVELGIDMGGVKTDMKVWVDMDDASKEPKLVEIIKMPTMLMSQYGPEAEGKEYIVLDINDMMKTLNAEDEALDVDFTKLMNLSRDLQPKMEEFVKTYFKDFKSDKSLVSYMGKKNIDGKDLKTYEVKLNDESLKGLVRNVGDYSLDNKEGIAFLKDYMNLVSSAMELSGAEGALAKEELDKELSSLESKLPEMKKTFNEFMDSIKDIKIIGDKGIVIELGIDNDGHIVSEKGSIDLRIDLSSIAKLASDLVPVEDVEGVEQIELPTGVISLGLNYNTKITNINKNLKINLPKVDAKNSISFEKLMEIQEKQMEEMMKAIEEEEAIEVPKAK